MVFLLCLLTLVTGKLVDQEIQLSTDTLWTQVTKFAMNAGQGTWSVRVKVVSPQSQATSDYRLYVGVHRAATWPACPNTPASSLSLPTTGEWSNRINGHFHSHKPEVWFFSLSNCWKFIEQDTYLQVELIVLDANGGHLSLEEQGLAQIYGISMLISILFIAFNAKNAKNRLKHTEKLEINQISLIISIFAHFCSLFFSFLNTFLQYSDGFGLFFLDFLSHLTDFLSQFILSMLLIALTTGWTLFHKQLPCFSTFFPIFSLFFVVKIGFIIVEMWGKDWNYGDYEGIYGVMLSMEKIILFGWFWRGIGRVKYAGSEGKQRVIGWVQGLGTVYLLGRVGVVAGSWGVELWERNWTVEVGKEVVEIVGFVGLTVLYDSRSGFYRVSTLSHSVLPSKSN